MAQGTILDPFTLPEALAAEAIGPGDTVYLRGGVYTQSPGTRWYFPSGSSDGNITWSAYEDERPILNRENDLPPNLSLGDYTTLNGIWLGGQWKTAGVIDDGGFVQYTVEEEAAGYGGTIAMGLYCTIQNCTFWGYDNVIIEGVGHHNRYTTNHFCRVGRGTKAHGMYLAAGDTPIKHNTVANNLFTGGEGLALSFRSDYGTIERCFFGAHHVSLGVRGDHCSVGRNVCYKPQGENRLATIWSGATNTAFADQCLIEAGDIQGVGNGTTVETLYLLDRLAGHSDYAPGERVTVESGTEDRYLGVTKAQIEIAISGLDTLFAQSVTDIAATPDADFDQHWNVLQTAVDTFAAL
jgi:hypothetical protein